MQYLSIGFNSTRDTWNGCKYGIHAEIDAMKKLNKKYCSKKKGMKNKKKKQVDLIVIRIGRLGDYRSSKPCQKCLESLVQMKCFKVRYIYYSTKEGTIVKEKFSDLYEKRHEYRTRRFIEEFY